MQREVKAAMKRKDWKGCIRQLALRAAACFSSHLKDEETKHLNVTLVSGTRSKQLNHLTFLSEPHVSEKGSMRKTQPAIRCSKLLGINNDNIESAEEKAFCVWGYKAV